MHPRFIRSKLLLCSVALSVLLNSCSLLFRYRAVNHQGLETGDFGLPVILYYSTVPATSKMVVFLSGDGGWLDFNDKLAVEFAKKGCNIIGFNSRTYFWHRRTPEETGRDIGNLVAKYAALWKAKQIILSGYSFGADVVPFIYNRLPNNLKNRVVALQLLSPFRSTDFKIYITDLINAGKDNRTFKVKDEVSKVRIPIYCFYGEKEDPKSLMDIKKKNFFFKLVPGDHEYEDALDLIITSPGFK